MESKWIKNNRKTSVVVFTNQNLNKTLMVDKHDNYMCGFGVEMYIIKPWNRVWFKWFKTFQEALDYANKFMKEIN